MSNAISYGDHFFGDDSIESISLHLASNLVSSQLEADTLTATVRTKDPSIVRFKKNTPLRFHRVESATQVLAGGQMQNLMQKIFYLQSVDRNGPDVYTLYAVSSIGLLAERPHKGGVYSGESAESVIRGICGEVQVLVKSNLKYIPVYGWLPYAKPPHSSARDNLSQVLFALGASVRADANGVLRVFRLWSGTSGAAPENRIYQGAGVEYGNPVSSVLVSEHQYIASESDEETLYEGTALEGDHIFFQEPMYDLKATGFSILSSGANYAVLSQGDGVLTGRRYRHSVRGISVSVAHGAAENVVSVKDATLLSLSNARFVAERLSNYYQFRETIKCGVVLKQQACGDIVQVYHPYNRASIDGCVEGMDINVSRVLRADMRILSGYLPPEFTNPGFYNRREVITVSGQIQIPEGTAFMRAVLIGGGYGGIHGHTGASGQKGGNASISGTRGDMIGENGAPGKGGSGGDGGSPGNVLIVDIEHPPATLYAYIGEGGKAQISPGFPPTSAEETFLIDADGITPLYSTEDGKTLENGYRDPITGDLYALPGNDGVKGGDGGEAGSIRIIPSGGAFDDSTEPVPGADGENFGEYRGGSGNKNYRHLRTSSESEYGATSRAAVFQLPAGGGGAAFGAIGKDAGSVEIEDDDLVDPPPSPDGSPAYPHAWGTGGAGADAKSPEHREIAPGCGGDGGNGGGGGGAGGSAYIGIRSSGWGPPGISESQNGMPGGVGGKGSRGTNGSNGCIILYFSSSERVKSGAMMDSKKRIVLDKYGRLIVI